MSDTSISNVHLGSISSSDTQISSVHFKSLFSISIGSVFDTGSIPVTTTAGVDITGLTVGQWYAAETTNGPWYNGDLGWADPRGRAEWLFAASIDGGTTYSRAQGYLEGGSMRLQTNTIVDWIKYAEAVDTRNARIFWLATNSSINLHITDNAPGDNSGNLDYIVSNVNMSTFTNGVRLG